MKRILAVLLSLTLICTLIPPAFAQEEVLSITAPAGLLMDAQTGEILYEKEADASRPCASITKVMTLLLVFEAMEQGKFNLSTQLRTSAHAAGMGGSDIWLEEGECMSVDDLLKATVIMSANDAAVVLAEGVSGSEAAFVELMNRRGEELGMHNTVFKNCNGLDQEGHLTTARDVALMSRALIAHEALFQYTTTWMDTLRDGATQLVNTNRLIKQYQGITGLKTGTTSAAGSCITATATREGLSLIGVVLGAESTTNRFQDAATLLDYGFANWKTAAPKTPDPGELPLIGGMKPTVSVRVPNAPSIRLPKDAAGEIQTEIQVKEPLTAPVAQGDILGKVSYSHADSVLAESPIYAAESVEAITFSSSFRYLWQDLLRIL